MTAQTRMRIGVALLVLAPGSPVASQVRVAAGPDSSARVAGAEARPATDLAARRELALAGMGAGLQGAFRLVPRPSHAVPSPGLSAVEIDWSLDRSVVGSRSTAADAASDWTRDGAVVFLLVTAAATAGRDDAWRELARRSVVYAEAAIISHGLTNLGKRAFGRPRPLAYLPSSERADGSANDPLEDGAFESMPSGHASSAWTAAALGMTEHLLSRPHAASLERTAVGLLGGGLAGATAALRVAAGQHFPSDVMVGAGIGLLTGVGMPLVHRGERPLPTRRAWLEMSGGALAGVLAGILVARGY